jgi:N-acylglucosamine 2-epimerase
MRRRPKKALAKAFRRREKRLQKRAEDVLSGRHLKNLGELSAIGKSTDGSERVDGRKSI